MIQQERAGGNAQGQTLAVAAKRPLLVVDELDVVGVAVDVGGVEGGEAGFGVGERAGDDVGVVDLVANFVLAAVTLDGATTGLTVQVRAGSARDVDG